MLLSIAMIATASVGVAAAPELPVAGGNVTVEEAARAPSAAGPSVAGYVRNDSAYRLSCVRLRIEGTDPSGHALPAAFGWVNGDVPAKTRMWFRVPLPPGTDAYRVTVESFSLVSCESR